MPSDERGDRWLGWTVKASIAKNAQAIAASVAARPSMLSRRLKAFVIPTSHTTPITVASESFETISTRMPGDEHERRRADLGGDLRERRQAVDVVDEPGEEEDRAAAEDAAELARSRG